MLESVDAEPVKIGFFDPKLKCLYQRGSYLWVCRFEVL